MSNKQPMNNSHLANNLLKGLGVCPCEHRSAHFFSVTPTSKRAGHHDDLAEEFTTLTNILLSENFGKQRYKTLSPQGKGKGGATCHNVAPPR